MSFKWWEEADVGKDVSNISLTFFHKVQSRKDEENRKDQSYHNISRNH